MVVPITLTFDSGIFSIEAVKRALYKFSDECSFDLMLGQDGAILVKLYSNGNYSDDLSNKIRNAVLDQDLRMKIAEETKDIRTLILAHAFSKTDLIDSASL